MIEHTASLPAPANVRSAAPSSLWHWPLLLVALPASLTRLVPDWMYTGPDYIDAWVYHGFFRHLESYSATMFPQTYYGSRLGWIVPGYVLYHVFEPQVARVVLHLTFYLIAVSAVYVIVRYVAGRSSALFAAVAFGLYLPNVRALGQDYVDGAVITYGLLTVALGLHGFEKSKHWLTLASGMAAGAMLNSNIGAALVLPSVLVWFVPERRVALLKRPFLVNVAVWGGGVVVCTLALSVISVSTGGTWDFFLQSVRWLRQYGGQNPWDIQGLSWIANSPWLFLPTCVCVSTFVAWSRRRDSLPSGQIKAVCALGLLLIIFGLFDFVGSGALLYWPFYASWLIPWTFVAIGALLVPAAARLETDLALFLGSMFFIGASLVWLQRGGAPGFGFPGFGVTLALALVAAASRHAIASRLAIAIAIVCVHSWLFQTIAFKPGPDRADAFQAVDRGVRSIERYVTNTQPRFLLTPFKNVGHYVVGLTSVYLWGYTIASDQYPKVTPAQAALIQPGAMVIVIAEQPNAAVNFDDVFAPFNLRGVPKGTDRIETAHGQIYLTFLQAQARTAS